MAVLSPVSRAESPVERAPAALKLGLALALIVGVGALPAQHALWGLWAVPVLLVAARVAKLRLKALLARLSLALPFLLGAGSLWLFQRDGAVAITAWVVKSMVSLLALQVLAATTSISELLRGLRRARVPEILCTTIALCHRFLFLLVDESTRMRRARAGRTLRGGKLREWRAQGNSIGLLFVRTVSRAERVHAAMRSRGGT